MTSKTSPPETQEPRPILLAVRADSDYPPPPHVLLNTFYVSLRDTCERLRLPPTTPASFIEEKYNFSPAQELGPTKYFRRRELDRLVGKRLQFFDLMLAFRSDARAGRHPTEDDIDLTISLLRAAFEDEVPEYAFRGRK